MLVEVAPRLAVARDQHEAFVQAEARRRSWRASRRLHLEWLIEHRELQLIRAEATGKGGYIGLRHAKLAQARNELASFEADA